MNLKDSGEKKQRSKRVPSNAKLTFSQISLIVATLLTDGWLELQAGGKNPRIGLQLCETSFPLLQRWKEELGVFCPGMPGQVSKTPPKSEKSFPQYQIRTGAHPEFNQFMGPFYTSDKKKQMPKCSYLIEYLTYESLAWILMFDGSVKSSQSKGLEIHVQGFPNSYASVSRLCVALYEKLSIMAKPTYYGLSKLGEKQYHIYISGHSLPCIRKNVLPYMLSEFQYKIPQLGVRGQINTEQRTWTAWYEANKNGQFREDLDYVFEEQDSDA